MQNMFKLTYLHQKFPQDYCFLRYFLPHQNYPQPIHFHSPNVQFPSPAYLNHLILKKKTDFHKNYQIAISKYKNKPEIKKRHGNSIFRYYIPLSLNINKGSLSGSPLLLESFVCEIKSSNLPLNLFNGACNVNLFSTLPKTGAKIVDNSGFESRIPE